MESISSYSSSHANANVIASTGLMATISIHLLMPSVRWGEQAMIEFNLFGCGQK
jgi:hypothetical protein